MVIYEVLSMENYTIVGGWSMVNLWIIYGQSMVNQWWIDGINGESMVHWLVVEPPLWKIWVCQLGWWTSQLNGTIKSMFQSPPTSLSITINPLLIHLYTTINHYKSHVPNHQPDLYIDTYLGLLRMATWSAAVDDHPSAWEGPADLSWIFQWHQQTCI